MKKFNKKFNKKVEINHKYSTTIKRHNFDVWVKFDELIDNEEKIVESILLITKNIYTSFENNKKYINLTIVPYVKTIVEESYIPKIKQIKICRYTSNGKLILSETYNDCNFICNITKYSYTNYDNADELNVTYKFSYSDSLLEINKVLEEL